MAKGKKTGGRDFKRGNPGRPEGARDKLPRGLVKDLVLAAVSKGRHEALKALLRNLKDPRRVLQVLELAARLNGELGMGSQQSGQRPVTMIFRTSLDPEEFRRRALARDAGKPDRDLGSWANVEADSRRGVQGKGGNRGGPGSLA